MSAQIEALKQQRVGLAEPLETQIRELNPSWKPTSLRPKADDTVVEILTAEGQPMSTEEIVEAVGDLFTPWKIKNTLKKKSTGAKAILTLVDGKYAVKAAA